MARCVGGAVLVAAAALSCRALPLSMTEGPPFRCGSDSSLSQNKFCEPARCGPNPCHRPFVVDLEAHGLRYDGHGATSAGASSRLLHDYPEPQRSEILDWLFLPGYAASLHLLKVEIGGDSQSGYGTEPSHMHHRDDLSCVRGYEFWLLREARLRNPMLVTYALAWAMPHWVGFRDGFQRGYHGSDSIAYLLNWLWCADQWGVGRIDYLGSRNARSWGTVDWVVELRAALDDQGFDRTKLIISDGDYDPSIIELTANNASFADALQGGGVGLHYPCYLPQLEVQRAGFRLWSSEDYGVPADWAGAGCWGRVINQNFVRMKVTSTVAKTLVRSVYSGLHHAQDAFVDAFHPWSGRYELRSSLWVTAHTTQFTEVGWLLLDPDTGSSGRLAKGGSYVTYVSPGRDHFTLVVEKLHGDCRTCRGQTTATELAIFSLVGREALLNGTSWLWNDTSNESMREPLELGLWLTNKTHEFIRLPGVVVDPTMWSFNFTVQPDSIYTASTVSGGRSGDVNESSRANATDLIGATSGRRSFPNPFADDFEAYAEGASPKYFADYGGSWQVAADPTASGNMVLKQWVTHQAGANQWVPDTDPISLVGEAFSDATVSALVYIPLANRTSRHRGPGGDRSAIQSLWSGLCLAVTDKAAWSRAEIEHHLCTSDLVGWLRFDKATGLISTGTGGCVTAQECPSKSSSDLCQKACAGELSSQRAHQTWIFREDGSIRLRAAPSLCVTAVEPRPSSPLRLLPCELPTPSRRQRWVVPGPALAHYAGVCTRLAAPAFAARGRGGVRRGYCLHVGIDLLGAGSWRLERNGTTVLAQGELAEPMGAWHRVSLTAKGPALTASVDVLPLVTVSDATYAKGMAALHCSWGEAFVDNFALDVG